VVRSLATFVLLISTLTGCGCPDDRAPSGVEMTLDAPLDSGPHEVRVCVDEDCVLFSAVEGSGGTYVSDDGDAELIVRGDRLLCNTFRLIEAGDHLVVVEVIDESGAIQSFESSTVEFKQVDRCHTDSTAVVDLHLGET
jgi:hypothetical protein